MNGRLAGKRAVVVGAGQTAGSTMGNGRAIAMRFAEEGARLLLVDRDPDSLGTTAAMLRGEHALHVTDIAADDGPASIAAAATDALGGIDVLVNNVGIGRGRARDARAADLNEEAWDLIHAVNLRAMWRTMKYCLPQLRADGGGAIVNVSSIASLGPAPMIAYALSKAGVNRLTQSTAVHEAPAQVRCNAVLPGMMDTPMAIEGIALRDGLSTEKIRAMRDAGVPMGHMGEALDTANAVLFLASDEARFITGQLLAVDGGQSARVG